MFDKLLGECWRHYREFHKLGDSKADRFAEVRRRALTHSQSKGPKPLPWWPPEL